MSECQPEGLARRVEELLKPGGEVIGTPPRRRTIVRRVSVGSPSPAEQARRIFEELAELGREVSVEPTRSSRPGRLIQIPDLGYVSYRETPTPTVDFHVSIEGLRNVKFKFVPAGDGGP